MSQENSSEDQKITPWEVQGGVVDGQNVGINYNKLISQFGCQPLTEELIQRFEKLTGQKAHHFLRRGIFFSHRDFGKLLDYYEAKKTIYLYTGRGPSSESMHLGHMVPFMLCKYFQDVFDCHLVIQLTDDEKFLWKDLTLEQTSKYAHDNAKDIIAVGFKPGKTFMFINSKYFGHMYETVLRVQKAINFNQASSVFGFTSSDAIGKIAFPAAEIAPAFPSSFKHIFGNQTDTMCFVPCAIDQDPFFRLARDIAHCLKCNKPASINSVFFPALQGFNTKMSASAENTAIFMTDSPSAIKNKINRYAFSGGQETLEKQRELGGNPDVDVAYQYLRFFMEDDEKLDSLNLAYRQGKLLSGELKSECIKVLQKFVADFQASRAALTPEFVASFFEMPLSEREKEMKNELEMLRAICQSKQ